jgi:hypothetical protein
VPQAKLPCGRVGDDVDGMVVQPGRPALGASCLHGPLAGAFAWRGESFPHASWWRRSCPRLVPRVMAHASVGVGGSSCEAETSRTRQRLVVRGGDFSFEAETCRARRRLVVRESLL